ncbi:hypothetical protein CEXT_505361 [Caerostris extrusa]|uniref:Uncharacterized protein n=1 Tax=Caerostris extrusa TaxID=172846 RepID=A0AAV4UCN6_CAEEX|nr:hypothetical protein CEXT_505361 [Caerostris extrusa]
MPLSMQIRRAGNAILESTHVTSFSEVLAANASKLRFTETFFGCNDAALDANKTSRKRHFGINARNFLFEVFAAIASKLRFTETFSDGMQMEHLGKWAEKEGICTETFHIFTPKELVIQNLQENIGKEYG